MIKMQITRMLSYSGRKSNEALCQIEFVFDEALKGFAMVNAVVNKIYAQTEMHNHNEGIFQNICDSLISPQSERSYLETITIIYRSKRINAQLREPKTLL